MTQNNLITIVTMWNKVNELSHENLPQQQIVTSSFHQCNNAPLQANVNATAPTSLSMPIPHIRHQSETAPLYSAISRPKLY